MNHLTTNELERVRSQHLVKWLAKAKSDSASVRVSIYEAPQNALAVGLADCLKKIAEPY